MRRRGPVYISGQDSAVLGNQVNAFDGALNVNQYGMNHNTRVSYDEVLTADKTYNVWEDLVKPIYFEVSITGSDFYQVTLIGVKSWANQTEADRTSAVMLCRPNENIFIYDEEFTSFLIEIPDCPGCTVEMSIFASGFIPDSRGVNQYRDKIDENI